MRDYVQLYINGELHQVSGAEAFMPIADYLRYVRGLTGTKIVCAEGDCGACTILVSRWEEGQLGPYKALNSCIGFVYLFDRCHVLTVEGLKRGDKIHPVQKSMVECSGAQCGYCTPGFICAMAGMVEDAKKEKFDLNEKRVRNYLTGNLCRCTGYDAIIEAGKNLASSDVEFLGDLYNDQAIGQSLAQVPAGAVFIQSEHKKVILPQTLKETVAAKNTSSRIISGATDLGVLHNKRKTQLQNTLAVVGVSELRGIKEEKEALLIGAAATLDQIEKATKLLFPEFSRLLHVFASPQIKNSATLVGNLINASPIADTIPFLMVVEAEVVLESAQGSRVVNVNDFLKAGYKELDLAADEVVTHIRLPKTQDSFKLYKVSKRRDLDISAVTLACRYHLEQGRMTSFSIAYGGVGPKVLRLPLLEKKVRGQKLNKSLIASLVADIPKVFTPLSDVRGSAEFRRLVCGNLLWKFYDEVGQATEASV